MFDFLRKKLNKTIKDASDSIPEEELPESQISDQLDNLESGLQEIEDKYSEDKTEEVEETVEEPSESVEEKQEGKASEDIEKEEEETTTDEETVETSATEEEEVPIEEETSTSEEESKPEEKESETEEKEEKKGFFGFLRRNKEEPKDKKEDEKTEEKTEPEKVEEKPVEEEKEEEVSEGEETAEEPQEKEEKEEKKSRFGFLKRDKKEEPKKDKPAYEGEEEKGGAFSFITKKTIKEEDISEILEDLEFSLIEGDVAFDVADRIVESVKEDLIGRKIKRRGDMELFTTNALKKAITEIIDNGSYDLLGDIEASKQKGEPYKIMFVGINGTGKTTTIAKIAKYLEQHGYSSVLGASDTFRAGAIEQLEHHAKNLNLKIIKHERNSDPAAVAFDAVDHARATGKDVVLIDTSGRMQTNANLMDEMKKIKRVSKPDIVLYVGDALMGNDATEQATKFNEVIDVDGIILTKADADAKGGAAISIGHVIHKPILFIGTGQSYEDLMEFKPEWMIQQIFEEE
ncbi:MAG: signal recognition particle-docking protein FtsY [Methanosphaera sp.]|nr:signal recognition particle-docking protein FtsY [Methanosphaera sp.]